MILAAKSANKKGVPVVLDVCGAGATPFRDEKCFEILDSCRVDIIKGNSSEIARIAGERVSTRGVDASDVDAVGRSLRAVAGGLAAERCCTVVLTGPEDIVAGSGANGSRTYLIKNGHSMMACIVGTGCMAASVIGTFAAVERDYALAAAAGLVCYEVAAEIAALKATGPGSFKERLYDAVFNLDEQAVQSMQKMVKLPENHGRDEW
jgi:hydroxyethylthiazole kinase